jgi:phosphatidylglycerol---prolipoprotein diacylglyceryl transferase
MNCGWQQLMNCIDPIALSIGSFQITWYALCFLMAWWVAYRLFSFFEEKEKAEMSLGQKKRESLFWWLLFAAFLGARLGYALFYAPEYFMQHISELFIPYDFEEHTWTTLHGMSYHGGLLGVGIVVFSWAKIHDESWVSIGDKLAFVAPVVSFFGRVGNFLNQELPGTFTMMEWGMYFPDQIILRHPVTLYSAFFEGVLVFGIMLLARKKLKHKGQLLSLYLFSYGVARLVVEIWREPDPGVALFLDVFSRGQFLSIIMVGVAFFGWFFCSKRATIEST